MPLLVWTSRNKNERHTGKKDGIIYNQSDNDRLQNIQYVHEIYDACCSQSLIRDAVHVGKPLFFFYKSMIHDNNEIKIIGGKSPKILLKADDFWPNTPDWNVFVLSSQGRIVWPLSEIPLLWLHRTNLFTEPGFTCHILHHERKKKKETSCLSLVFQRYHVTFWQL